MLSWLGNWMVSLMNHEWQDTSYLDYAVSNSFLTLKCQKILFHAFTSRAPPHVLSKCLGLMNFVVSCALLFLRSGLKIELSWRKEKLSDGNEATILLSTFAPCA